MCVSVYISAYLFICVYLFIWLYLLISSADQPRINPGSTHMCPYLCICGEYPLISVYIRPISVHIRLYLYISVHICSYPITCVNICTYVCICLYRQYLSISVNICPGPFSGSNLTGTNLLVQSQGPISDVHICAYVLISYNICVYQIYICAYICIFLII